MASNASIDIDRQQRITQDYMYLMRELYKVLSIKMPEEDTFLIEEWKDKFINEFFARVDSGRTRNIYLAKFIECIRNKKLTGPFLELPPYGDLPEWQSTRKFETPQWLKDMQKKQWINTTGEPFQYYFSRKSLDLNRGVCACISIAFPDKNDNNSSWHKMGRPDEPYSFKASEKDQVPINSFN